MRPMLKTSHLVERVSALQLFYCFGENFQFTSRLTVQYLKTQQKSNVKSPVICWLWQIFYVVLHKNRKIGGPLD